MISLLLHNSEAKQRMSVNNKDIIRMYLGCAGLLPKRLYTNQCFFCEQQAMALSYAHLSKLLLSLAIYSFDSFWGDVYL